MATTDGSLGESWQALLSALISSKVRAGGVSLRYRLLGLDLDLHLKFMYKQQGLISDFQN